MTEKKTKVGRPGNTNREAILTAAAELLKEGGSEALSFRKLGRRLGVSAPSLYTYFKDKQTLLQAITSQLLDTSALTQLEGIPARDRIERLLTGIRETLVEESYLIFLLQESLPAIEILTVIRAISSALEEMGVPKEKAVLHAQSLLWMVMGFAMFEYQSRVDTVTNKFINMSPEAFTAELSELTRYLDITSHDRLWRETLDRNLKGILA